MVALVFSDNKTECQADRGSWVRGGGGGQGGRVGGGGARGRREARCEEGCNRWPGEGPGKN